MLTADGLPWTRTMEDNTALLERAAAAIADADTVSRMYDLLLDCSFKQSARDVVNSVAEAIPADYVAVNLVVSDRQVTVAARDIRAGKVMYPITDEIRYSFCQYVAAGNMPIVISDARRDPLVEQSPTVVERGLQSYLGVPVFQQLRVHGAVCVAKYEPYEWTADELGFVTARAATLAL